MINESAFTDKVIDSISNYIASTAIKRANKLTTEACLLHVASDLNYPAKEVKAAFGDLIETAIKNSKSTAISEHTDKFSNSLLEDNVHDTAAKVDAAVKAQNGGSRKMDVRAQAAYDKQTNKGNNVRSYFIYINLIKGGQIYICSELTNTKGFISTQFAKLGNFLKTCTKPTFTAGILAAPISAEEAEQFWAANKGKFRYIDLTPDANQQQNQQKQTNQQQNQQTQQNTNTNTAANNSTNNTNTANNAANNANK